MAQVVIEVPDALAADALSRRLDPIGAAEVELEGRRFVVELAVDEHELVEVLRTLQGWLGEEGIPSLRLRLGDRAYLLAA